MSDEQKKTLPSNIIAYTRTNNVEELRQLYAVADVFINPTYEDNFPTTNIEALACGTPVITYDTGGSPEAASTIAGAVVDVGHLEKGHKIIKSLIACQNVCLKRSREFAKERMIEKYKNFFDWSISA